MNNYNVKLCYKSTVDNSRHYFDCEVQSTDDKSAIHQAFLELSKTVNTNKWFMVSISSPDVKSIQGVPFVRYSGLNIYSKYVF
jgi:hypothetical protein